MCPSTEEIIEIIRVYANITGDISLFKIFHLRQFCSLLFGLFGLSQPILAKKASGNFPTSQRQIPPIKGNSTTIRSLLNTKAAHADY
jgi:hypothetical protein